MLVTAHNCWRGLTIVWRKYLGALIGGCINKGARLNFAAFNTTSSPPLFLLPLKFQFSPTLLEILPFISQHITKYFVHEHLPFVKPIMCMSCENHEVFTVTYYCYHYVWRQWIMCLFTCRCYQSSCSSNFPSVLLWLEGGSLKSCSKCLWINHCLHYNLYHWG